MIQLLEPDAQREGFGPKLRLSNWSQKPTLLPAPKLIGLITHKGTPDHSDQAFLLLGRKEGEEEEGRRNYYEED